MPFRPLSQQENNFRPIIDVPSPPKKSLFQKASDISQSVLDPLAKYTGIEPATKFIAKTAVKIAEPVAKYIGYAGSVGQMGLEKTLNPTKPFSEISKQTPYLNDILDKPPSEVAKKILGTTAQTMASTYAFGGGAPKTALQAIEKGAITSGGRALGANLTEDQTIKQAAKGSILPTIAGSALSLAGFEIRNFINYMTDEGANNLYKRALKQSTEDLKKEIVGQAPDLSRELLERGIKGSDNEILAESMAGLKITEDKIQDIINNTPQGMKTIQTADIANSLDEIIRRKTNVLGIEGAKTIQDYKDFILSKGDTITLQDALPLKRDIYKELSQSAFNIDAHLGEKAEGLRTVAHTIREQIADKSEDLAKLTDDQWMWERTAIALTGKLARTAKRDLLGLNDVILGGGGVIAKSPEGIIAAMGKRSIDSTIAKTYIGQMFNWLRQQIEKLPTDQMGNIGRTALSTWLEGLRTKK